MAVEKNKPKWKVDLSHSANRQMKKLPSAARDEFLILIGDMEADGPYQKEWHKYGPLKKDKRIPDDAHHCHFKSGKPTYVACWRIVNKKNKTIEVFYVGTHENTPYKS